MHDYVYTDGRTISQLSTPEICECLLEGVEIVADSATVEAVIKRLELELFIRRNNLRG